MKVYTTPHWKNNLAACIKSLKIFIHFVLVIPLLEVYPKGSREVRKDLNRKILENTSKLNNRRIVK